MHTTRRQWLGCAAALAAPAGPRYRLGCQTLPYAAYPLVRALGGIQKAGYRYVFPNATHQRQRVFAPELSASDRAALKRQFADHGLEPFGAFVGLGKPVNRPEGAKAYLEELDLCAEFGIRTVVGVGPWYYTRFPNLPKRARDWQREVDEFYAAMEKPVRHAESLGITITLKPHTGITATAKACLEVVKRLVSDRLKICWDAGNVSFYEGIHPDPDLEDLAPHVKAICIKDHRGGRAEANFPTPGEGQIDHDLMFGILFGAGFDGPIAVERVDGKDGAGRMSAELIDERIAAARRFLVPLLDKHAGRG